MYIFLIDTNILFHSQYGFRKKHSTIDAITEFITVAQKAIEKQEYTVGIC